MRQGHFKVNRTSCTLYRHYWAGMPAREELESLAADPIIWHGNGAGKRLFMQYGHDAFQCNIGKWNMTEKHYMATQCCYS